MWKFRHKTLIFFSGMLWFAIGMGLLFLGLNLITHAIGNPSHSYPLLQRLTFLLGTPENGAVAMIAFALFIGYFKGRYALGKSAQRVVKRIRSFPNPCSIFKMYSWPYYLLILSMILLGSSFRYFGLSEDIRGFVDVIIGSALINGGMIYFRIGMLETNLGVAKSD